MELGGEVKVVGGIKRIIPKQGKVLVVLTSQPYFLGESQHFKVD